MYTTIAPDTLINTDIACISDIIYFHTINHT